ncbi:MAG: malate synthase A, partial [Anaerolineales bacterium]
MTAEAVLTVNGPQVPGQERVLTPEALAFLGHLEAAFGDRRRALLARRAKRQAELAAGVQPRFPRSTAAIRAADWQVAPSPADLQRRHVEITGPTDRKMLINALNSGADVFMADFEDANSP